jgi:hypothetical protein
MNESRLSQQIDTFFTRSKLPSREDIQKLDNQLDDLSKKLAEITGKDR